MSGCGGTSTCPECHEEMETYTDWKPYDMASGQCLECGFYYYTKEDQLSLAEVNEYRKDRDLEPLTELAGDPVRAMKRAGIQPDKKSASGDTDRGNGPGED